MVSSATTVLALSLSSEGGLGYLPSKRSEAYSKAFSKLDAKTARKLSNILKPCN